jgi:hypothetical protein
MICYFDSDDKVNLSHIPELHGVRPLSQLKDRLLNSNFEFDHSTNYKQGVYVIEVSKHAPHWCGYSDVSSSRNILLEIPAHTINAVREKILRIVIIATIEGDDYISKHFNGYQQLTNTAQILNLPKGSIIIASGNLNANNLYRQWCKKNFQPIYLEFVEGIEWSGHDTSWQIPITPLINQSLHAPNVKDFNSLNRAHRQHRTDHLYFLAKHNLMDNIISGGTYFDQEELVSKYVTDRLYKDILLNFYPRTVDLSVAELKTCNSVHPSLTSNFSTYTNSLLTVVTESHYAETGLFITEKTMRPIALGHPFMVLGQPHLHKKLNELGFKTDFINPYDSIDDHQTRFDVFHKTLIHWKNMPYDSKVALIEQWYENIEYNFYLYKQINFKKLMFDSIIESTKKYFSQII